MVCSRHTFGACGQRVDRNAALSINRWCPLVVPRFVQPDFGRFMRCRARSPSQIEWNVGLQSNGRRRVSYTRPPRSNKSDSLNCSPVAFISAAIAMIAIIVSSTVLAEQPTAPAAIQAEILTRILPYERAFASRVKGRVVVALAQKPGDAESASSVQQMRKALGDIGTVRNYPLSTVILTYSGAAEIGG